MLVLLFTLNACNVNQDNKVSDNHITLRVPDTQFMGILPLYVADEKGFFNDQGIEIQWIDIKGPGEAAKAFFAGQADLLMSTFANLIPAELRESGYVKFLLPIYESSERPGSYILVRPNSEIKSINDLKGKTLGTYSGPSQKVYALIVLKQNGLDEPKDVRLVQVSSSSQIQGLFGGAYDALFTVETYGSTAIENGAKVIDRGVRTKYISDPFWLGSAVIRSELIKENPEIVDRVLKVFSKAVDYINKNDKEVRFILSKRTNTSNQVAEKCALYTWVPYPDNKDYSQIQAHINLLKNEGLIEKTVDVKNIFESSNEE